MAEQPRDGSHLVRAVVFVAIALALHVAASVTYARTVGREHDAVHQDQKWLSSDHPVDLMIAGDSHSRFGLDDGLGKRRAINVAVPGEHYLKSMFRVPWLLDHGDREVEAVILSFDAASFSSFKSDSYAPEYVWARYVDLWGIGLLKGAPFDYAGKLAKGRLAPYVGEFDTLLQYVTRTEHFRPEDADPGAALKVMQSGQGVARRHFRDADPWDPYMVWALRQLLAELRQREIRVVLVRFPVTASYAKEADALGATVAKRDALFEKLGDPGWVDQLDFERAFFEDPTLFSDGDHLNAQGKRELTLLVRDELVRLGIF